MNIDFYDKHYKGSKVKNEKQLQAESVIAKVAPILDSSKHNQILEVGCGVGILGQNLIQKYDSQVYGIDLSKEAIKQANSRGVKARVWDIETKWPYPSSKFDVVISTQVLEHLVNPDHYLKESRRVLKNNGILIITTPNLAAWFNRIILLFGYQPFLNEVSTVDKTLGLKFTRRLSPNREPLGHIHVFTLKALKDILELYKFEMVASKGGAVTYFPKYIALIDKVFSFFPGLATDSIVIAKNKK